MHDFNVKPSESEVLGDHLFLQLFVFFFVSLVYIIYISVCVKL